MKVKVKTSDIEESNDLLDSPPSTPSDKVPANVKLLIGASGIYASFLYLGSLQEDVFNYQAEDGSKFHQAWFLQVLEALANLFVGFIGMRLAGQTTGLPLKMFGISGVTQVSSKAFTSMALANGLSFPVATLAKSGKMAPVMIGQLLLGGSTYTLRQYLQVAAIILGTAIVSMGKKKASPGASSVLGVVYIIVALACDGLTAGYQKRLKRETEKIGVQPKPYDFMFWTNLSMCMTATLITLALGEFRSGVDFLTANPIILSKIIKFSGCSAIGQSFIFYTIAHFDPLVVTTITTTRKILSVLFSIFTKGHSLSYTGWSGLGLAIGGIISELKSKSNKKKNNT